MHQKINTDIYFLSFFIMSKQLKINPFELEDLVDDTFKKEMIYRNLIAFSKIKDVVGMLHRS